MLKRGLKFAPGYTLQEFLGRGQFGQVWRATAPGGTGAAVKFIDLSEGQGQKEYEAVKRVKQIRHANLMPITAIWLLDGQGDVIEEAPDLSLETLDFSSGSAAAQKQATEVAAAEQSPIVDASWLVVAMLLAGKSLQARLRECVEEGLPGIPPKELISYMEDAAKGIDFLNSPQHDLGEGPIAIQHSDVKPANIVLIGSSAVVCDFGLARILTRNQVTATSTSGTPAYMAPEAIAGKPARTSDQYSLAVTYYHLRTGMLPVSDGSLWEVLDAHRLGNLKLGLVPEAEQQLLRKATDLDWEKRFESNAEMVGELRDALRREGQTQSLGGSDPGEHPDVTSLETHSEALATVTGADDPTATVETERIPPQDHEPAGPTTSQPFNSVKETTEQGFADPRSGMETGVEPSVPTATRSAVDWIKTRPQVAAIVVTTSLLILLTLLVIMNTGDTEGADDKRTAAGDELVEQGQRQSGNGDVDDTPAEAMKMLAAAISQYDADESTALALFADATKLDSRPLYITPIEMSGHRGGVMLAQFVGDEVLVSVADEAFVWTISDDETKLTPLSGHEDLIATLAVSPDPGRWLTGGYDTTARVWNLNSENIADSAVTIRGHTDAVIGAAWHPTEPIIVTISNDPGIGVWELGRATDSNPFGTVARHSRFPTETMMRIDAAAIDPQGRWFATIRDPVGGEPAAIAFDFEELTSTLSVQSSPKPLTVTAGIRPRIVTFAGDQGKDATLVVGDDTGGVSLYGLSDPPQLISRADAHRSFVESIAVADRGASDIIVSGSSDGSVHWWMSGGSDKKRSLAVADSPVSSVDVSADGRWVAAGVHDGAVWLWDASSAEGNAVELVTGSMVHVVRIDPQQKWLIAGCEDGVVRRWDLRWAKLMATANPTRSR